MYKKLSNIYIEIEHPHTRLNPMTGQSVLVCPHRMLRPWSGQVEPEQPTNVPEFDATNPLCPGTVRSNGEVRFEFHN